MDEVDMVFHSYIFMTLVVTVLVVTLEPRIVLVLVLFLVLQSLELQPARAPLNVGRELVLGAEPLPTHRTDVPLGKLRQLGLAGLFVPEPGGVPEGSDRLPAQFASVGFL